jgi:nondiscriminating aspartyl-tRNA synthetase
MNPRILAAELPAQAGRRVTIAGWLHRRRELKSVTFLIVRDRSGLAQVVLRNPADAGPSDAGRDDPEPALAGGAAALPEETVIAVEGVVTANPQAPGGAEITDAVITPLSGPATPPPFDLYRPAVNAPCR